MGKGGRPLKVEPELEYLDGYVEQNDFNEIKRLINEYGVNCYDPDKRTLLIKAASKGNLEVLEYLLEKGADVNFQDKGGYSSLHFAAQNRHENIARVLLENGADINIKDEYGNPPVWIAIFNAKGDFSLIKLLVKKGAEITSKNSHGKSPKEMGEIMLGEEFTGLLNGTV